MAPQAAQADQIKAATSAANTAASYMSSYNKIFKGYLAEPELYVMDVLKIWKERRACGRFEYLAQTLEQGGEIT